MNMTYIQSSNTKKEWYSLPQHVAFCFVLFHALLNILWLLQPNLAPDGKTKYRLHHISVSVIVANEVLLLYSKVAFMAYKKLVVHTQNLIIVAHTDFQSVMWCPHYQFWRYHNVTTKLLCNSSNCCVCFIFYCFNFVVYTITLIDILIPDNFSNRP